MTCYNQRAFVLEAIMSVLDQSYNNLELIVIDDGSSDGTPAVVRSVRDARLTYIWQKNKGPSAATNRGILLARGEYVAFMAGDDVCKKDRLEFQLEQIGSELDLVFSLPKLIDDASQELPYFRFPDFYKYEFKSTGDLFQILFKESNFLCAPSAFARRSFFNKVGVYKVGLIQLQDYELWIRACRLGAKIARFDEPIISYRLRDERENLSAGRYQNRVPFELHWIYSDFFDGAPIELIRSAFPNEIDLNAEKRDRSVEVDILFLYLNHRSHLVRSIGIEKIMRLLEDSSYETEFEERGFGPADLFRLTLETQPYAL